MVNRGRKSFQGNVKRNTCEVSELLESVWVTMKSEVEYTSQCLKAGPHIRTTN